MSRTYEYWREQEHSEETRDGLEYQRYLSREFEMYLEQIRDKEIDELSSFLVKLQSQKKTYLGI